ncbi:MAG: copper chaperone PCu(A)C [Wenzhouxiangella sp.]|jgi:copper(I)-binding protein|nr:copper chaperone PCu(A)C [Wenzhouxiangella sp.]
MNRFQMMLTSLLLLPAVGLAEQALVITDAWSPEAPPGRMMAGFMELHNQSDEAIVLVDGESPLFGHVEIHTMIMDEGVMRMRRLEELVIEAGQSVELRPGGLHLMLIEPLEPLALGDTIDITLIDDQGDHHPLVSEIRQRNRPSMVD